MDIDVSAMTGSAEAWSWKDGGSAGERRSVWTSFRFAGVHGATERDRDGPTDTEGCSIRGMTNGFEYSVSCRC